MGRGLSPGPPLKLTLEVLPAAKVSFHMCPQAASDPQHRQISILPDSENCPMTLASQERVDHYSVLKELPLQGVVLSLKFEFQSVTSCWEGPLERCAKAFPIL